MTVVAALFVGLFAAAGVASAAPYGDTSPAVRVVDPGPCDGSYVNASGSGFAPGETVNVSRDGAAVGTATADASGQFTFQVNTVGVANGTHSVTATGTTTAASGTSAFVQSTQACTQVQGVTNPATNGTVVAGAVNPAYTGTPAVALGVTAGVLLLGGAGLVIAGRRRGETTS